MTSIEVLEERVKNLEVDLKFLTTRVIDLTQDIQKVEDKLGIKKDDR